uniref:F-box domain-containing protein n=1 Tax=Schizophyllum commune (strain H4-8 / FGSC 9210) TaxID=578458 RepID=D8PTT3_SCHCM
MKRSLETSSGDEARHDVDNTSPNLESQAVATRTRKRQKMRDAVVKSKPKKISPFLDNAIPAASFAGLPPEVLYEVSLCLLAHSYTKSDPHPSQIFSHCDPVVLVQLTKMLWKQRYTACTGYELPPAADDISVPRLAMLIIDETCSLCNAPPSSNQKAPIIIWNARIRWCKACLYASKCHVRPPYIPLTTLASDRIIYEENLFSFEVMRDVRRLLGHTEFRPPDLFPGFCASRIRAGVQDKTKEEKKAYIALRAAEFGKIKQHAHICKQWEAKIQAELKTKEKAIRKERLKGILRRLNVLGLETEARHPANWDALRAHAVVSEPKELTEEGWDQICGPLLEFVNGLREKRLAHERREIIRQRYDMLEKVYKKYLDEQTGPARYEKSLGRFEGTPARALLPQIGALVTFREVTELVEGTPVGQALIEGQMGALIEQLAHTHVDALGQTRFDAWRAAREAELVALLNAADPARATTVDLRLAATVFSLAGRRRVQYPAALAERPGADYRDWKAGGVGPARVDARAPARGAGAVGAFRVEPARLKLAEQVVRLAGLDPRTATPAEMDAQVAWVALKSELDGSGGTYRAMTWRYAVLGSDGTYDWSALRSLEDVKKARFVLLSDKDTALARSRAAHAWAGLGYADLPRPHKYQRGKSRKRGVL